MRPVPAPGRARARAVDRPRGVRERRERVLREATVHVAVVHRVVVGRLFGGVHDPARGAEARRVLSAQGDLALEQGVGRGRTREARVVGSGATRPAGTSTTRPTRWRARARRRAPPRSGRRRAPRLSAARPGGGTSRHDDFQLHLDATRSARRRRGAGGQRGHLRERFRKTLFRTARVPSADEVRTRRAWRARRAGVALVLDEHALSRAPGSCASTGLDEVPLRLGDGRARRAPMAMRPPQRRTKSTVAEPSARRSASPEEHAVERAGGRRFARRARHEPDHLLPAHLGGR